MHEPIKELWKAGLTSGNFTQGREQLRSRTEEEGKYNYCCLGVLCEIALKAGAIESYSGGGTILPDKVRIWAGMKDSNGVIPGLDDNLWELNDYREKTFEELAAIIDKHWEEL